MANFNNYNNNKGRDENAPFEPNVYTPFRMNNAESLVDQTCLTFSMWKRMLKIGIFPRKNTGNDEIIFDMDNGIAVYLNPFKAHILACEIRNFLSDPDTYNGCGVPTGKGIISISNGIEFSTNNPVIVIRKIDEAGNIDSSFAYEIKGDYYFAVRGYTGGNNFTKVDDDYRKLELEMVALMLEEFVKAMTYTTAYTITEQNKYNDKRINDTLNNIAEKLGVETRRSGNGGGRNYNSATSFFNNNSGGGSSERISYPSATLDDLD